MIGAIAEFVGAFGVILTLGYLASQIRQQNKVSRHAAWQSLQDGYAAGNLSVGEDSHRSYVYASGLADPSSLSVEERAQFDRLLNYHLHQIMKAHYAYESGFLSEDDWKDQLTIFTRIMNLPGGIAFRTSIEPAHEGTRAFEKLFDAADKRMRELST